MKKAVGILIALLAFSGICVHAASDITIDECVQNVEQSCIDVTISVSEAEGNIAVLALRNPKNSFENMKAAQSSIISVAQVEAVSPSVSVQLFYSDTEDAEKIYIYASCSGEYIDEKVIPFYSQEDFIVISFKNAAVWNGYPELVSNYGKAFDMFTLTSAQTAEMKRFTQTEIDDVYKSMFRARSGFKTTQDIEKAYSDAVDGVIRARSKNSGGDGIGGRDSSSGVVAGGTNASAPAADEGFTDLDGALWAKTAIEKLKEKGIINGVSETHFAPDANIKREDFVTMIIKAKKCGITDKSHGFSDVQTGTYYEKYVNTAAELGIVMGMGNSEFGTGNCLTREDLAVILYRAFYNGEEKHVSRLPSDWNRVSDYAKTAVETLAADGVISGMPDGTFAPDQYTTRAQTAQLIYQLMLAGRM